MMHAISLYAFVHGTLAAWGIIAMSAAPFTYAALWYFVRFVLYLRRGRRAIFHDPKPMRYFTAFSILTLAMGSAMISAPLAEDSQIGVALWAVGFIWFMALVAGGSYSRKSLYCGFFLDEDSTPKAAPLVSARLR